jgi:hypothetical protein
VRVRDAAAMTERRVRRIRALRWRDTRLWIGIGLVVGAMVLGARMLSAGEDRILVWAATGDMAVGAVPTQIALTPVALGAAAMHYFPADQPPTGRLAVPVTTGTLIPRDAVVSAIAEPPQRYVTVSIDASRLPHQLAPGQQVDVWSVDEGNQPALVLPSVLVEQVASDGGRGAVSIVFRIDADDVGSILAPMRTETIDLVAVPVS